MFFLNNHIINFSIIIVTLLLLIVLFILINKYYYKTHVKTSNRCSISDNILESMDNVLDADKKKVIPEKEIKVIPEKKEKITFDDEDTFFDGFCHFKQIPELNHYFNDDDIFKDNIRTDVKFEKKHRDDVDTTKPMDEHPELGNCAPCKPCA